MTPANKRHFTKDKFHFLHKGALRIYFFLILTVILCVGTKTSAADDDPGAGRLSGTDIPSTFYEGSNKEKQILTHPIEWFGATSTQSPYTNKTYIHRSDLTDRPVTHGIDVSEWQKEIDWAKVKADGIQFAFIRVGYRGSSQGTLNDDTYFKQNLEGALAAGVEVGVYIFSQAITTKEAKEEAEYLLERIKDYNITFPVVLDYEFVSDGRLKNANLSQKKATNICLEFCKTVSAAGYTPMVYANPDMLTNYLNAEDISNQYAIWLANYTTETSYTGKYDYWQYSSDGSVDGIEGSVDMNFFYGTDIANAGIAPVENLIYTGSKLKPSPVVTYKDKILINGIDYSVSYSNNTKVGTAKMTVTGKGIFYGSQTVKFKIMPRAMSTVKAKKRATDSITLSWSKDNSISGYQLYRATAMDGKYKKIATITKKTTTTYTDKKRTNGQCYYYKIRSYKTVDGKNWYGAFSDIKAIYTKTGYTRNAFTKKNTAIYDTASISETPMVILAKKDTMSVKYATRDKHNKTWYYVQYKQNGQSYNGFIAGNTVTITKLGKTTGKNVNVRKSASTSSKKLTTLNKNKKVTILKTKKKSGHTWYQIQFTKKGKTYKGWISADYIKII